MFLYLGLHFTFCFLFFLLVQKSLFIAWDRKANPAGAIHGSDVANILRHGYRSDLIGAAYLTAFPLLVLWAYFHTGLPGMKVALGITEGLVAIVMALVTVADTALYRFWQFKIDSSVFLYLRTPKEAFASVSALYLVTGVLAVLVMAALIWFALWGIANVIGLFSTPGPWLWWHHIAGFFGFLLCAGLLFAFIRGIASRPNNPSLVFYSTNPFYNHCALNPLYNIVYSLTVKDVFAKQFRYTDDSECQSIVRPLYPITGKPSVQLLNTRRPNIVLVIWESLCEEYAGCIGGRSGVTENLDRLAALGVLFSNVHSASFRTDRALPAVIGGVPGQPTASIIRYTRKIANLPAIASELRKRGWRTSALHGGDMSVMHISDYFLASGHDKLIQLKDLPADAPKCRWGVHDNYMFDVLFDEIMKEGDGPWMKTLLTLSSHEPFKVPFKKLDHDISNAFAFTDDALGRFIDRLKNTDKWADTLVIILGDHGLNNNDKPIAHNRYPHIPLVMTGGAVKGPFVFDRIMSQTDLAATLLGQLDIRHDNFPFSRDVLSPEYVEACSYHSYVNGFIFRDETGYTDYDNVAACAVENGDAQREQKGRMIQQALYTYLNKI